MSSSFAILSIIAVSCIAGATSYALIVGIMAKRRRIARANARAERRYRLAHYDDATGLPNRKLFTEQLLKQLSSTHDEGQTATPIGLVYAELRGYHRLVERLGQDRMKRILGALCAQLAHRLKPGDALGRLSHDGLILMIRERDSRTTLAVLSAVRAVLSTPLTDEGESFRFGWAIGSSRAPDDGDTTQVLIRAAMNIQHHIGAEAATLVASQSSRYALAS